MNDTKAKTLLALDEAKRAVRARSACAGYSASTATEQLRQIEALERVERLDSGSTAPQVTVSTTDAIKPGRI